MSHPSMGRIISGYNRLFASSSNDPVLTDDRRLIQLKGKALSYVQHAFQDRPRDQGEFLLGNTKKATVQANVSLMLLCDDSSIGRTYRQELTTLNGYNTYSAASDFKIFYYLCLLADVPEATLDDVRPIGDSISRKGRKKKQDRRLEGLIQATLLMTNYIHTPDDIMVTEMISFKKQLQHGNGYIARIWALHGIGRNCIKTPSIFTLHQRVSLLQVMWNEFRNIQKLHPVKWITSEGYKKINGDNPEHFHYYADIANDHRLAIDAYVKTNLNKMSTVRFISCKKETIPRSLSVCSWKHFLPEATIHDFVKQVCNGGVSYMYHNNKYIRMAKSPDYPLPTEFFLSANKFPCDFACTEECKLLKIANHVFSLQNALLREKEKEAMIQLSKTQPVNVMMTTISKVGVSCGFTEHNDWATLLATLMGETVIVEDGAPLPQRHLMQVLTIGFVYPFVKGEEPCIEFTVKWRYNEKTIGKITTTGNFAHLQLFGVNDRFFTHEIEYPYRGVNPNAVRVVLTFRRIFSCDPCNRSTYDAKVTEESNSHGSTNKPSKEINQLYKHKNVINKLLGIADSNNTDNKNEGEPEEDKSSDDEETDPSHNNRQARIRKRKLKYAQLKPYQYKRLLLPRPGQPRCLTEPMGNTMGRSKIVLKLIREHNILTYRHYGILQNKPGMWVKEDASMYKPGEDIDMEETALSAGIVYSRHQHNFAPSDALNDAIFMFGYKPKNDCLGLKSTYELIQKGLSGEIPADEVQLPDIFTFGSGGNPNKQGRNAPPPLHKASKNDAAIMLQTPQTIEKNNCNSTADAFLKHEFLVAVIVNDSLLEINTATRRGRSGKFLFIYKIRGIEKLEGLDDDEYKEHVRKYGHGCDSEDFRFLQDAHIMIKLRPALTFSEYMKLYRTRKDTPFKRLYFPWNTQKRIVASNLPNMVSRKGKMRHQNKVYEAFVNSNKQNFIEMAAKQYTTDEDITCLDLNGEGVDFISGDMSLKEECYTATAADLVMCCILISAANAYRHVGHSLAWVRPDSDKGRTSKKNTKQNTLTALPLVGRWQHWYLGVTNQCIPINSPNRSFDVIVLLQEHIFNKQNKNLFHGSLLDPTHNGQFSKQAKRALFVAIVTRFTGNPTAILHYESQWNEEHKKGKINMGFYGAYRSFRFPFY